MLWLGFMALAVAPLSPARAMPNDQQSQFSIIGPTFNGNLQGPVGAFVTVQAPPAAGANLGWTPNATVAFGVVPVGATCNPSSEIPTTPTSTTVQGDGSFNFTFAWPTAAGQSGGSNYYVCAQETSGAGNLTGKSSNTINILTNAPPTIQISSQSVHQGDTIQVTGTNWLPVQPVAIKIKLTEASYSVDPGDSLTTASPDPTGTFHTTVIMPTNRDGNKQEIIAVVGDSPVGNHYPLEAALPLTIADALPTATPAPPTPSPVATTQPGIGTSRGGNNETLLIALLGVIAVVLLGAGVIVAVLALRGRNAHGPGGDEANWGRSGPRGPGREGNYGPPQPWDETVAGGQDWDHTGWQPGAGQPWSGRESRAMGGPVAPPPSSPYEDEDDDRFRTRMGDPYQPGNNPGGPPSRANGPRSFPRAPAGPPAWDDDFPDQNTNQGPAFGPPNGPRR